MEVIFSMAAQDVKLHWNEDFLVFFHILQGIGTFYFGIFPSPISIQIFWL